MLFQFILNGLTNGSLYALMAVGVTMVYKSLGMLNFSHGDIMMIGTFIALTIIKLKVPLFASLIIAVLAAAVIGFLLERLILRRVEFSSFINLLIATVGVSYILRNGAMVVFGTNPQRFPSLFSQFPVNIAGFKVSPQSIGIILVSVTLIVALHLFFTRVKVGKCMELASSDAQSAAMMGINVSHMRFLGLACIAGALIAPLTYARPDMSAAIGLKAFAAAILGGIGNLWGALLGGIILGVVEALGAGYISSAYRDAFSFLVLFFVLFVKPTGLLSRKIENKL